MFCLYINSIKTFQCARKWVCEHLRWILAENSLMCVFVSWFVRMLVRMPICFELTWLNVWRSHFVPKALFVIFASAKPLLRRQYNEIHTHKPRRTWLIEETFLCWLEQLNKHHEKFTKTIKCANLSEILWALHSNAVPMNLKMSRPKMTWKIEFLL